MVLNELYVWITYLSLEEDLVLRDLQLLWRGQRLAYRRMRNKEGTLHVIGGQGSTLFAPDPFPFIYQNLNFTELFYVDHVAIRVDYSNQQYWAKSNIFNF